MELKTPLYDCHVALSGKIVPFAGYLLPVQYPSGVIAEHMAVRQKAGLFDVSHMGEVFLSGPDALSNLNRLMTNDFTSMTDGQVRYSLMCNENGGIVDDLIVYRMNAERYMVVVNAANRQKDAAWMRDRLSGSVLFEDASDDWAQIALQGPRSRDILAKLAGASSIPEKYYTFIENGEVAKIPCIVSQTGYTGEHGYELYCKPAHAAKLWNALLEAGREEGLIPCGLGTRDTLRLEAAMPLYGHEMDDGITPLEAGLGFAVKMKKPDFIGKSAIEARGPLTRKRVGLLVTGRGIARENCPVYLGGAEIGRTTSGTHLPFLAKPAAMALLDIAHTEPGAAVEIDVRGRKIPAEVVALPFYKRP